MMALAPQVVFHAAAHKHVPLMEDHPGHAVANNLMGTKSIADAAVACGAERFVMISSDKAVNPASIMGATKRLAEIVCRSLQGRGTQFVLVRFGNVFGSAGSVIPRFREQIGRGGPVTVTHPDITRYFMSLSEATQLLLQAALQGKGDEILVLDMGEPVRIIDLAHDMIRLSGADPSRIDDMVSHPAGRKRRPAARSVRAPAQLPPSVQKEVVIQVRRPVHEILERHVAPRPRHAIGGAQVRQQLALASRREPEQADPKPLESAKWEQPPDAHIRADQPVGQAEDTQNGLGPRQQIFHLHAAGSRRLHDMKSARGCQQKGEQQLLFARPEPGRRVCKLAEQRTGAPGGNVILEKPFAEAGVAARAAARRRAPRHIGLPEYLASGVGQATDRVGRAEGGQPRHQGPERLFPWQAAIGQGAAAPAHTRRMPLKIGTAHGPTAFPVSRASHHDASAVTLLDAEPPGVAPQRRRPPRRPPAR